LSVSLVVSVTSGYASAEAAAHHFMEQFLGGTDATLARPTDARTGVDESLVAKLNADPRVASAVGRFETETQLIDRDGKVVPGKLVQLIGIRRPDDREVESLRVHDGRWFDAATGDVAVVDQVVAEALKLKVGDAMRLPGLRGPLDVKVVAVVQKPGILASAVQTVYVPLGTLQQFAAPDAPRRVSRVLVNLRPGTDAQAFGTAWRETLAETDPALKLRMTAEGRRDLDKNMQGLHVLSYLGGMVSMLAATFIVFSALSMGVTERQRTLAMLRAIGARRAQVARLVVIEGVLLAAAGVAVGVPLGILWIKVLTSLPQFEGLFESTGVVVSGGGILLGGGGSLAAAIAASLLPAYAATRVDPLEAMAPLATPARGGVPWRSAVAGLLLVSIDPLLFFGPVLPAVAALGYENPADVARAVTFYGHFALGLPGIMIGFFLLAPLFVWAIERALGPVVAAVLGLRFALLRQQLSGGIWRAAGTCAALMVGLSILVVLQTQGRTVLNGWRLPDKFPDVFIFSPTPIGPADYAKIQAVEGVRKDDLMPIAIASPTFGTKNIFALVGQAMVLPDATMFFGIDPEKGMRLMELDFRDPAGQSLRGDDRTRAVDHAVAKLKEGRHLIVTDEFRQLKGLHVGGKLPLITPKSGKVEYTIAGVVWSPGIDVITSRFDLGRQLDQRTAASVFGSLDDARRDFDVDAYHLFAANLDFFVEREPLMKRLQTDLGNLNIRVGDIRQIKKGIQDGLNTLLMLVSTVAFAALGVASLGVTNTVMASVRSRRWQLGVLRSIGVTRGQLLRLVLAEAVLIGLVGSGLGLAAGLLMAVDANALSAVALGYNPPMDVPWGVVALGVGAVMLISVGASLWPAVSTAREQPLSLLQAGRSAA
ncbi:MAG TPA: FtsX-like permease family protein, partial [Tepidisphaeraceae bacterium]|nr:FtsX-like permease family protein [Tepidisphaeraceae bacterium]